MTVSIQTALGQLSAVTLEELDAAQLHDRVESKVLTTVDDIAAVLAALRDDYLVLDHAGTRTQKYMNKYFDCAGLRNYHDHHNQNGRRLKVRYRTYVNSDITYFEIKRSVRGRTVKERRRSLEVAERLHPSDAAFFYRHTQRKPSGLVPSLRSDYDRILLVSTNFCERVTIDFNLTFADDHSEVATPQLAICEFKQPSFDRRSPAMTAVRRRPQTFSKYCMGLASCDRSLPRNRFKKVFRVLEKMGVESATTSSSRLPASNGAQAA